MKFNFYALKLTVLIVIVFILQILINGFNELFVLNESSWREPWRFFSAVFLHGGIGHLAYNSLALLLFGSILERFVGGKRFILTFLVTGVLANMISVNFYSVSLGASGAIFGIIGALVFVSPGMTVWAFGMPMPMVIAGGLWMIGDLIGAYGFLSGNPVDSTGNIAHLAGIIFGFILGWRFRKLIRKVGKRRNVSIDEGAVRMWEDNYIK